MTKSKGITLVLSAFFILLFTAYFVHFSTGIPKGDDFPMMFMFLDDWDLSQSFHDKYLLLTKQFLDHRMVAMKITVLGIKSIYGKMDINAVNGVGVVLWLGTIYLLFRAFSNAQLPVTAFLPVILLTLHPGFGFDGLLWAATWMAFPWAIFLCLISFYFLAFHTTRIAIILGWLFAFLALFSHGNGIFCFLIGLLLLIIQKKWRPAWIWLGASSVGLFLFFFNYVSGGTSTSSPLENLIERPLYVISSIGAFIGGSVYFPDHEMASITSDNVPAIVFGLILCIVITIYSLHLFWKLWSTKPLSAVETRTRPLMLFCCAVGLFVIITAVMISCVRTSENVLRGFAARYHFYSALMISVVYLMCVALLPGLAKNITFKLASVSLGILYCFGQYWYQTAGLANQVRIAQAGLYSFEKSKMWTTYQDSRFWERGIDHYSKEKLWPDGSSNYKFPKIKLDPDSSKTKITELEFLPKSTLVEIEDGEDDFSVHVRGSTFKIALLGDVSNGIYVNLVSENKSYLYPVTQERAGLRQFLRNQIYYKPEGRLSLKKKWYAPGTYKLFLYIIDQQRQVLIRTNQTIHIKAYPYEV